MQIGDGEQNIDRLALAEMVVRRVKAHESADDIVFEICNRTAWDWEQARRFMDEVTIDHGVELASWEMRLFFLMGAAFILVGLSLIGMSLTYLFGYDTLLDSLRGLNMLVGFTDMQALTFATLTGLAMVTGGMIGVVRAFGRMSSSG